MKYTEVLLSGSGTFPTNKIVRGAQASLAGDGPPTTLGVASLDSKILCQVNPHGRRVTWVPAEADSQKKRLLVCPSGE